VLPAPFSVRSLNERLTKDAFDQNAATQLLREAALTQQLRAGDQLAKSVQEFSALVTAAASPTLPGEAKKLRKEVQKSLRAVTKELARYNARIASSDDVYLAEKALRKATASYLARNSKGSN
jgi:glycerol-3-phosphate dehydrogenase